MSGGPSIFSMITGIGKSFDDSYEAAEKSRLEREAPNLISDYTKAASGGAAAPAPGGTLGTIGQMTAPAGNAVPSFAGGQASMHTPGAGGDIENRFIGALKSNGLTNPFGLAAVAAYASHESGYKGNNINGSWSDPSESGAPGTSGGILSWRGDRFANMRRLTAGAQDPVEAQAKFTLIENPDLTLALQNAKSPEEANRLMADAWKFAGYNRPGGEAAARLNSTRAYLAKLGGDAPATAPSMVASAPQVPAQRPVQVAENEAQTQALEQRMGMVPNTATAEADMPVADAQPAQFQIPGQAAPAAAAAAGFAGFGTRTTRSSPEQMAALQAMWRNPNTRAIATQIYGSVLKGEDSAWTLSAMGDQPVLFNAKTAQIVPVGQAKRSTATVGNAVVDTATGQVIYQGPDKDADKLQSVAPGTTLYDPRARQPVFTAPNKEAETKDEGAKIAAQVAARKQEAAGLGLKEGTPAWQAYVGTGKIGRDQDLSATDKKAIQEADEGVLSAQTAIEALGQAKTLSKQAYEGPTAGARGTITSIFGSDDGIATQDLHNVVTTNALGQLRAIFGGNPTEGERKILLDIQGSVNQPDAVRQKIFDRGIALAQKRLDFNQRRAEDLRGGTYYKQDGAPGGPKPAEPRNSLPVRVTPQMKPEDVMKRYPSGTRLILPDGSEGVVP